MQGMSGKTDWGTKPAVHHRFTTDSPPVHHRFISETKSALRSWLLTSVPTPICLCKPFSCKACPKIKISVNEFCELLVKRQNDPQVHQTPMSLPIYMGTGTVALCKTDPVSWAQTLMPLYPIKAHFHKNCSPRRRRSLVISKASKKRRLNVPPEARTSEILCKPNAGTK